MRKVWIVLVLGCVIVLVICTLRIPFSYTDVNRLYKSRETEYYQILSSSNVTGSISAEEKFSAFILTEENKKNFEEGKSFESIASWEDVYSVKLDLKAPEKACCLVVKNEESKGNGYT